MNLITINNMLYLGSNLFRIYVLFRFINVFFHRKGSSPKIEIAAFLGYYVVNSSMYLLFFNPLINLVTNIILFFLLTFIYKGKNSTRLIATVLIYVVNMLLESIVYNLFSGWFSSLKFIDYVSVISSLIMFILVLILEEIFNGKTNQEIKSLHTFSILLIPVCSIIIVVTAFLAEYNSGSTAFIVGLLLIINVFVFYLYDVLNRYYEDKYEKKLLKQQNTAYANQFEIIQVSQDNIRKLRHDMKNHLHLIKNMVEYEKKTELQKYLDEISSYVYVKTEYVNSGNAEVDSILNYKILEAKEAGATVDVSINIPETLNILSFDLNIILGNLIDNAIDAFKKCEDKELKIQMELERSILYITVINTYKEKVRKKDGKILTTKEDNENHGIGLKSVENTIKKYDGDMIIEYNDDIFQVDILMYNPCVK